MNLCSTTMASPIGALTIVAHDTAIVAIRFDTGHDGRDTDAREPVDAGHAAAGSGGEVDLTTVDAVDHAVLRRAVDQLDEYFAGERTEFDLPLDPAGTPFQRQAWQALARIPYGQTISYGEQARMLGDANKSRAVGAANGRNPIPIVVPCHRVVGSNGHLTGFAGGLDTKAWLLDHELRVRAAG